MGFWSGILRFVNISSHLSVFCAMPGMQFHLWSVLLPQMSGVIDMTMQSDIMATFEKSHSSSLTYKLTGILSPFETPSRPAPHTSEAEVQDAGCLNFET